MATRKNRRRAPKRGGSRAPTFHIQIVTAGRPTLKDMVDNLRDELKEGDALTIIFDGKSAKKNSKYSDDFTKGMKCAVNIKEQIPGLKHWGHPTMNKNIPLLEPRTYVMFADDDDTYIKGSFDILRKKCTDPNTLYVSKMKYAAGLHIFPRADSTTFSPGNIGKPNGIIPFKDAGKSAFGNNPLGDYDYYKNIKDKVANIVFLDDVIYMVGRDSGNAKNGNVNVV